MSNEPIIIEQIQSSEVSESLPIIDSNTVDNPTQEENKKPKNSKSKKNSKSEDKDKEEQENPFIRTFTIHLNKKQDVKFLRKAVYDYKHLENMIILLIKYCKHDNESRAAKLLLNNVTMKAVLKQTAGGEKTKDNIEYLNNKLKKYDLFQVLLDYVEDKKINGHNISMLVRRLKKDYKNHKDRLEKGIHSNEPKAKSLNKVTRCSIPLEPDKWTLAKQDHIGVNLYDKMYYIYCPFKGKLFEELKHIQNVTVSVSNDQVYLNIGYDKREKIGAKTATYEQRKEVRAGGDVGVINLLSLFIDDHKDNSLILSGKRYINYNCYYNKQISNINEEIAKNAIEYREVTKKDGEVIKIPTKHNQRGIQLKNKKKLITEKRNRFFDEEFLQLALGVVRYCKKNDVTSLVLSKNLSFAKKEGSMDMNKKTKQKFYQIPFGRLLNKIQSIGQEEGIDVDFKDEAYTSKSSCLSVNVAEIQKIKKEDKSFSTDFGGSRLKRGLFFDKKTGLKYNADMNASANHIVVKHPEVRFNYGKIIKRKLTSPLKIKRKFDLQCLLKRYH